MDPHFEADRESGSGSRQAKTVPPKKEKLKKFHVGRVLCWARGFSWSLNILYRGLKWRFLKIFLFIKKPWSGSGYGFSKMPGSGSGSEFGESGYITL
jgi:hypothetical protein